MPKKGNTEEQIVAVSRRVEAGERVTDIRRKAGISQATDYLRKRQYASLGLSELRELRQLREENGLVADLRMDRQILQEIVSIKLESLSAAQAGTASGSRNGR